MPSTRIKTRNPNLPVYALTMQDGANLGLVVADDCAVAIDLPIQTSDLPEWRAQITGVTDKPLHWIVFSSPERVSAEVLRALAPHDKPAPKVLSVPTIIHDAGFQQLYAALEASQPRAAEPLSPFELRKRGILPEITFSDRIDVTVGALDAIRLDIVHIGGCMPGASFVTVRDSGVVFAGDHIATESPPVLYANSDLDRWIDALGELHKDKKLLTVVPGRGHVGEHDIVQKTLDFLKAARSGLRKLARTNKPRSAVASLVPVLMQPYQTKKNGAVKPESYLFSVAGQSLQLGLEQLYDQLVRKPPAAGDSEGAEGQPGSG